MKKYSSLIRNKFLLRILLSAGLCTKGYLLEKGWFNSYTGKRVPVDKNNNPLPWYTYPFIDFIAGRLNKSMSVLEFGAGQSTLWWSQRVNNVISCEHDILWFNYIKDKMPGNVQLFQRNIEGYPAYSSLAEEYSDYFDILIIDGRDRVNCIKNSIHALNKEGIVIWDNSEREKYQEGFNFLLSNGFKRIDFTGIGPLSLFSWTTSVFYRDHNCLNL